MSSDEPDDDYVAAVERRRQAYVEARMDESNRQRGLRWLQQLRESRDV